MKSTQLLIFLLMLTCSIFAQKPHRLWLQGTWEGSGTQMDGSEWSMKLRVKNNR